MYDTLVGPVYDALVRMILWSVWHYGSRQTSFRPLWGLLTLQSPRGWHQVYKTALDLLRAPAADCFLHLSLAYDLSRSAIIAKPVSVCVAACSKSIKREQKSNTISLRQEHLVSCGLNVSLKCPVFARQPNTNSMQAGVSNEGKRDNTKMINVIVLSSTPTFEYLIKEQRESKQHSSH